MEFEIPNLQPTTLNMDGIIEAERRGRQFNLGHANVMHECLSEQIADFEKNLKKDEEVGGYLSAFGQTFLIQIEEIGYHNPYLIVFYGKNTSNGEQVQLVQHTSQISVLFVALKVKEDRPARRIGFHVEEKPPEKG